MNDEFKFDWEPDVATDAERDLMVATRRMYVAGIDLRDAMNHSARRADKARPFPATHQVDATVSDLCASVMVLIPMHQEFAVLQRDGFGLIGAERTSWYSKHGSRFDARAAQVAALFKSIYFFGRALQDAVCLAMRLLGGFEWKERPNMAGCMSKKGAQRPETRVIELKFSSYREWFTRMVGLRNSLKAGMVRAGAAFRFDDGPRSMRLRLSEVAGAEDPRRYERGAKLELKYHDVGLEEVTELMNMSTALMRLACETKEAHEEVVAVENKHRRLKVEKGAESMSDPTAR